MGRSRIQNRNSKLGEGYHFMGSFEAHNVYGVGGDSDEDESHGVEVEGAPVVLDQHVGVASDKDDEVDLLCFVADADYVLIG